MNLTFLLLSWLPWRTGTDFPTLPCEALTCNRKNSTPNDSSSLITSAGELSKTFVRSGGPALSSSMQAGIISSDFAGGTILTRWSSSLSDRGQRLLQEEACRALYTRSAKPANYLLNVPEIRAGGNHIAKQTRTGPWVSENTRINSSAHTRSNVRWWIAI